MGAERDRFTRAGLPPGSCRLVMVVGELTGAIEARDLEHVIGAMRDKGPKRNCRHVDLLVAVCECRCENRPGSEAYARRGAIPAEQPTGTVLPS